MRWVMTISDIFCLAFDFLADRVTYFMHHLEGMQNVFIIHVKFYHGMNVLSI
jgi:hypothetical protein